MILNDITPNKVVERYARKLAPLTTDVGFYKMKSTISILIISLSLSGCTSKYISAPEGIPFGFSGWEGVVYGDHEIIFNGMTHPYFVSNGTPIPTIIDMTGNGVPIADEEGMLVFKLRLKMDGAKKWSSWYMWKLNPQTEYTNYPISDSIIKIHTQQSGQGTRHKVSGPLTRDVLLRKRYEN